MVGKSLKLLPYLCILILLASCASGGRKARGKFRRNLESGKFKDSLEALKDKTVTEDKKSRALLYMEEGLVLHLLGHYQASNSLFYRAKQLRNDSYTKISQKLGTFITNDNDQDFIGSLYEFSHLHFYIVLNHYLLYQRGEQLAYVFPAHEKKFKTITAKSLSEKSRRQELFRARATLLAWDSMIKNNKDDRLGKSVFKYDLLGKVFGGFVHEAVGTRSDLNIAYNLYKKAIAVLERNYNGYPVFNEKYKEFNKNFSKFPNMGITKVKQKYVVETNYQKSLKNLLHYKILQLAKKIEPMKYARLVKKYRPAKSVLSRLKRKRGTNVCFVLQDELVPLMKAEKYDIGLESAIKNTPNGAKSFVAHVGMRVLMSFALNELDLLPRNRNSPGALFGVGLSAVAAYKAAISFELPKMAKDPITSSYFIKLKGPGGEKKLKVAVVNPVGDLATEMVDKQAIENYIKTGSRVALKHASAIATSYATYKLLKSKSKSGASFLAKSAAVIQYLGLARAIDASEKADIRYWSSLPKSIRMAFTKLKPGKYELSLLKFNNGTKTSESKLKPIEIKKGKKDYLINVSTVGLR